MLQSHFPSWRFLSICISPHDLSQSFKKLSNIVYPCIPPITTACHICPGADACVVDQISLQSTLSPEISAALLDPVDIKEDANISDAAFEDAEIVNTYLWRGSATEFTVRWADEKEPIHALWLHL